MQLKSISRRPAALLVVAVLVVSGCAMPLRQQQPAPESLVLVSGIEIPCRIVEVDLDAIYFDALLQRDQYTYGDRMPFGEIRYIKVWRNGMYELFGVDDYIKTFTVPLEPEETEAVAGAPAVSPQSRTPDQVQSGVIQSEFGRLQGETGAAGQGQSSGSIGLQMPGAAGSGTGPSKSGSPIGLRAPDLLAEIKDRDSQPVNYSELADLIVASGSTGLVLYRATKLQEQGIALTKTQQELLAALRSSEMWQTRRRGLLEAHRFLATAFRTRYPAVRAEIERDPGFRARNEETAFNDFVLHLHSHGDLRSARQRERLDSLFDRQFTRAMVDILANFNDWYYIAALQKDNSP